MDYGFPPKRTNIVSQVPIIFTFVIDRRHKISTLNLETNLKPQATYSDCVCICKGINNSRMKNVFVPNLESKGRPKSCVACDVPVYIKFW